MKNYSYKTRGTCSSLINFSLDENNVIQNLSFVRGCEGNLKGISALCVGKKAEEVIEILSGITCGGKTTSCPDQLSRALKEVL